MNAEVIDYKTWDQISEGVHFDCFGNEFPVEEYKTFDFAILTRNGEDKVCYCTVKELDKNTAYLNFGGMFPLYRGQRESYAGFKSMVDLLRSKYKHVAFITKTKNIGMIKLGLNENFEIIGLRRIYGVPHLEFLLRRDH